MLRLVGQTGMVRMRPSGWCAGNRGLSGSCSAVRITWCRGCRCCSHWPRAPRTGSASSRKHNN
ncbi:hypothetical protein HaLaN_16762, partial [Haematococcus lacustris]